MSPHPRHIDIDEQQAPLTADLFAQQSAEAHELIRDHVIALADGKIDMKTFVNFIADNSHLVNFTDVCAELCRHMVGHPLMSDALGYVRQIYGPLKAYCSKCHQPVKPMHGKCPRCALPLTLQAEAPATHAMLTEAATRQKAQIFANSPRLRTGA